MSKMVDIKWLNESEDHDYGDRRDAEW